MKAIKMRIQKFSRPGVILLAAVVAIITSMVVANATQTITTPNAAFISYSLAAGASSAPITPVGNRSVLVMGCCTISAAVGQVSLLRIPSAGIEWIGLNPQNPVTGPSITSGNSIAAGNEIVIISDLGTVDIRTASADTILIHNGAAFTETGNVTLIW
jgi:hypothetical protein